MYDKKIVLSDNLKNGYQYFLDKDHTLAPAGDSRVLLHRHIMSIHLGRWLTKEEHVHHIDGNKLNNSIENLEVLSNKEHAERHYGAAKYNHESQRAYAEYTCKHCSTAFRPLKRSQHLFCSEKCSHSFTVKDKTITKELLDELIPVTSWTALGKMFGYSDNGIKKRAKALGCDITKAKIKYNI